MAWTGMRPERWNWRMTGVLCAAMVLAGGFIMTDMTRSSAGEIAVACSEEGTGQTLPPGFLEDFCLQLRNALQGAGPGGGSVNVALTRTSRYAISAAITTERPGAGRKSRVLTLSIRDSELRPSMAKSLAFPVVQMLEAD